MISSIEQKIFNERTQLLYGNGIASSLLVIITSTMMAVILYGTVEYFLVFSWLGTMISASILRIALILWRYQKPQSATAKIWVWRYALLTFLISGCWGWLALIAYGHNLALDLVILVFLIAASSLAIPILIAFPLIMRVYFLPAITTMSILLLMEQQTMQTLLAVGLTIYTLVIIRSAQKFFQVLINSLQLRFENEKLVVNLNHQNEHTVSLNQQLKGEISERRAVQQELERHQEKLEQLVTESTAQVRQQARIIAQSHDSIVTTDLEGYITSWNHGAEKVFGFLAPDAIGRHISIMYPNDQHEALQHQVIQPLLQNGKHEIDVLMCRADHSTFDAHLSLSLLYDDEGEPRGMVGYSTDITQRKLMENALRESESNLAHAQAIAHIGSWYFDISQDELRWSEETYRIFDIDPSTDIELERFVSSIHDDDKSQVLENWELALSGKPYDIEHRIIAGGKEKWVRQVAEVVFDGQGEAVSALGITQDITELKQAGLATQEALIEARRLAKVRSDFVANMSHEIRTPLNAVLGLANMGERGSATGSTQELFSRIKDSGQHLLRVVNDILDFSKIDAGKLKVESKSFKLASSVENAVNMLTEQANTKGLAIVISMSENLPSWVLGDPMRLEQILVNLLSNGVKFTEEGKVELSVTSKNDIIAFSVSDTGVGLSSAQISQLFKPFEQGDSSSTRQYGGTGLGLSISLSLAKIMQGDISVNSQLHVGSEFTLSLPLPAATTFVDTQEEPPVNSGDNRLKGLRILAAEDIEVNRLVLADLLGQEGAHVLFAENGLQAVELVKENGANAFDVVLMDIQMPKLDGYSATRQMLSIAPGLPIIGLTAHALAEEKAHCIAAGMVDHVAKPVNGDALVMAIQKNRADNSDKLKLKDNSDFTDSVSKEASIPGWDGTEELIDWLALQDRFKGRNDFINKLLSTMLKSQQNTPQKLRLAVKSEDIDQIYFQVHSLKSMAGNLQAGPLDNLARQTEVKIKENSQESLALALQTADVLERVLQLIEHKLHGDRE